MDNIKYITFATKGSYETVANNIIMPSLIKFNLPYKNYIKPNLNNWDLNTRYKAHIILEALEEFNEDLVFIDADGEIKQYPSLFYNISPQFDIGVCYIDWYLHWKNIKNCTKMQLASGTLFIKNNNRVKDLIKNWIIEQRKSSILEQQILQNLLNKSPEIKVYNLPIEYCVIPLHDNSIPNYIKEPVILHHQISRKLKNKV